MADNNFLATLKQNMSEFQKDTQTMIGLFTELAKGYEKKRKLVIKVVAEWEKKTDQSTKEVKKALDEFPKENKLMIDILKKLANIELTDKQKIKEIVEKLATIQEESIPTKKTVGEIANQFTLLDSNCEALLKILESENDYLKKHSLPEDADDLKTHKALYAHINTEALTDQKIQTSIKTIGQLVGL